MTNGSFNARDRIERRPLIVAHRGASADAPENTLASLQLGYAQGADFAECDVRLTRDGEVVLLHDASLRRTAGVDARVDELSLAELRRLEVGSWRGERWRGEKIPTLIEALELVSRAGAGRRLLIEIKSGPGTIAASAAALAASGCDPAAAVLMSFDPLVTAEARLRLPAIERHWLTDERAPVASLCERARAAGCTALNVGRALPIDHAFVAAAHASGLKVFVWTVDDAAEARRLAGAGVDGLTTNRPGALRGEL